MASRRVTRYPFTVALSISAVACFCGRAWRLCRADRRHAGLMQAHDAHDSAEFNATRLAMKTGRWQFGLRGLLIFTTLCCALCAAVSWVLAPTPLTVCQPSSNDNLGNPGEEFRVRSIVFRKQLESLAELDGENPCFLSLGPTEGEAWIEAPKVLMGALSASGVAIFPVSEGAITLRGSVVHRKTRRPGRICWVKIVKWESATRVEVEEGEYFGPLAAVARAVILEKDNAEWRIVAYRTKWVS
jgi:hypothetical protein